jgi:sulfur carrier protein ThiS
MALAVSMLAAQKSATDCFSYFPMGGDSFGYSSDEGGGGTSYLGVDTRNLTPDRLAELKLKDDNGVEVTMVDQDAPAGKAGIKEHDVILSVNGSAVQSVEQLRRMIREIPSGRVVTLGLIRDGQPMTLKAELAVRKTTFTAPEVRIKPFKFDMPNVQVLQDMDIPASVVVVHSSARSGLMVENLTPQLGMFFGSKDGHGVLVRSVEKGSAAEKAGFHAGDVIVRVNDEPVSDTGDFTHTLRSGKQNTVSIGIIRDKKEQTLSLTLPERKQSGMQQQSFDMPNVDVEIQAEVDAARAQVAELQPEVMRYAEEIKRIQPEIEKAAKEAVEEQKEMRMNLQKDLEKMQEELRDQQEEYQELMQHTGGGADI